MAYCKTKTYINLKRIADKAYANACETNQDLDWDHAMDLELDAADYAYDNEEAIDWEFVKNEC